MKTKLFLLLILATCFVSGFAFAGPSSTVDPAETAASLDAGTLLPAVEMELPSQGSCAPFAERTLADILTPEQIQVADSPSCVIPCRIEQRACMLACIEGGVADPACTNACADEFDSCKGACMGFPWPPI